MFISLILLINIIWLGWVVRSLLRATSEMNLTGKDIKAIRDRGKK